MTLYLKHFLLQQLGPFVDENNPIFKSVACEMAACQVFPELIQPRLFDMLSLNPQLNIILVPSPRDLCHPCASFPQPPLFKSQLFQFDSKDKKSVALMKRIHLAPNPSMFAINEVLIGVSTADILFHLGAEELSRLAKPQIQSTQNATQPQINQNNTDRMSRLVKHLFQQQSFYPLSPPNAAEVPFDYGHSKYADLPCLPDILLLPSRLGHFAKIVEGCLTINPGPVCKKYSGGTYARLTIHPMAKADFENAAEDAEMFHGVEGRCRTEIVRV